MAHEELEQLELAARELEVALAAPRGARARVEAQVAGRERLALAGRAPAQQRVQARGDLLACANGLTM